MNRYDLPDLLYHAMKDLGGRASIVTVCKYMWQNYEQALLDSGDLFFTWQYNIRWTATKLRKTHQMKAAEQNPKGIWELA